MKADVKEAVDVLHASDFVFGDLRGPIIVVVWRSGTHPIVVAGGIHPTSIVNSEATDVKN